MAERETAGGEGKVTDGRGSCQGGSLASLRDGLLCGRVRTRGSERRWLSCAQLFATPWTYTVHGILQARILEWVAIPFSRDRTHISCIAGRFFTS